MGFAADFAVLGVVCPEELSTNPGLGLYIVLINSKLVSNSAAKLLDFDNCDATTEFLCIVPLNTVYDMTTLKRVGGRALHVCNNTMKLVLLLENLMVDVMSRSQLSAVTVDQA